MEEVEATLGSVPLVDTCFESDLCRPDSRSSGLDGLSLSSSKSVA